MTNDVLLDRLTICSKCESYHLKVCLLGHITQSWLGCPKKKFPPFGNNFGYAEAKKQVPIAKPKCCGVSLKQLSWPEVVSEFYRTMSEWIKAGTPIASKDEHTRRLNICRICEKYRHFQCELCACVMYVKAKLESAKCSAAKW